MSECVLFEHRAFSADRRRNLDTVHKAISMNTSQHDELIEWMTSREFFFCIVLNHLANSRSIIATSWKHDEKHQVTLKWWR